LWIRSIIELAKGQISFKVWVSRLLSIFDKRLNRIPEIIEFEQKQNIPSIFFFGMANIFGMSYKKKAASPWIRFVLEKGSDAGVHGAEFKNIRKIQNEFNDFKSISNKGSFGIRTHYVRYDDDTFNKMASVGYLFDTSEFKKMEIEFKPPYKINCLWEFPLHLMDSYIMAVNLESAKNRTIDMLDEAKNNYVQYFTVLFHDYYYNEKTYPNQKAYFEWFVDYCKMQRFEFISYRSAINELERSLKFIDE
jgi:hypothetical protein